VFVVHQAIKLEVLERFRLVAGLGGIDRVISTVGIIDSEEIPDMLSSVRVGEFLITNFLIIRNQPEMIVEYIRTMIDCQAACLAIKAVYYDDIPKEAIALANKHHFPVFVFDETYIDTLVIEINRAINYQDHKAHQRILVDQLLEAHLNDFRVRELAKELNRSFKNNYIVYFIKEKNLVDNEHKHLFSINHLAQLIGEHGFSIKYKEGYLVVATYEQGEKESLDELTDALLRSAGVDTHQFITGRSDVKKDLGRLGKAIYESFYAIEYARLSKIDSAQFNEIGVYQLLMPLSNDSWVHSFYKDNINKLIDYDQIHGTDLLETAIKFIENDGDIQQTAHDMFQHTNTVRYRLKKIANIMGEDQLKGMAYEILAMVIRLYLVNK